MLLFLLLVVVVVVVVSSSRPNSSSTTKQAGRYLAGSGGCLVCVWAFFRISLCMGFWVSWVVGLGDLDLLLSCHIRVLACVEKGASCNSNDADDAQVILTASQSHPWPRVAAQPKKKTRVRGGWTQYGIQSFFSKGQGEKVRATWGLRFGTNSPIWACNVHDGFEQAWLF